MKIAYQVEGDEGFEQEPSIVTASTPERAASLWLEAHGHDADDRPYVRVTSPGGTPVTFLMQATVRWKATRVAFVKL